MSTELRAADGLGGARIPPLAAFSLIVAAVHLILFLTFAPSVLVLRPYSDMFDLIDAYFSAEKTGAWAEYLFQPHSYHRIPLFRALLALDINLFKGTGIPFLVVAGAFMAGTALLLVRQSFSGPVERLRIPAATFTLMILATTANVVHVGVPTNTPYVHALFFSVLALLLAEPPDGAGRSPLTWRRAGALACACAAALSLAAGFVLWPVLAFMAWRRGAGDRAWLILLCIIGGLFANAYILGLRLEGSAGALNLDSLLKAADYFVAFLGLPWVRGAPEIGRVIGLVMLVFSVMAVLRKGGAGASRYERVAVSLILFSLCVAALAAAGRQNITEAVVVPGRYNLFLVPMKVGLVQLVVPWLGSQRLRRHKWVEAVVAAVFLAYACQQIPIGRAVSASAEQLRATITAFNAGVRTPAMQTLIHPDLARAEFLSGQIHERRLFRRPGYN